MCQRRDAAAIGQTEAYQEPPAPKLPLAARAQLHNGAAMPPAYSANGKLSCPSARMPKTFSVMATNA
ncbi:hypothetical protein B0G80_5518 [Paraburkholderia sp. BL6669N2]|nr:hypothetical protein B0G80_5518 [Paraburkholderia sp. BL6669N2]